MVESSFTDQNSSNNNNNNNQLDLVSLNDSDDINNDNETYKIAFRNTLLSIAVSLVFGAGLWAVAGPTVGQEFFAGYIVEKSLSVDNLFVFLLLFNFFEIPQMYQNRILTWGIYGSVIMRAIMIAIGSAALHKFRGISLVFAGVLMYSAVQVLVDVEEEMEQDDVDNLRMNPVVMLSRFICDSNDSCDIDAFDDSDHSNPVVTFSRTLFPSTDAFDGDKFFTFENGIKKATPMFVCMIAVELSDVIFAVDSIPAVFGVTEVRAIYLKIVAVKSSSKISLFSFLGDDDCLNRILWWSFLLICLRF